MKLVTIGELLARRKDPVIIQDNKKYKRVTIRIKHKGVCLRDEEIGEKIGTKRQFITRAGDFILSRIDARHAAFGIVPDELEGAIITNDFWTFAINEELVDLQYFYILSQSEEFLDACKKASKGTTNRKRIQEDFFLNYEFRLPDLPEQREIAKRYNFAKASHDNLQAKNSHQLYLIESLKKSILADAVSGQLVAQNPNDEPAKLLLKKIKKRREKWILDMQKQGSTEGKRLAIKLKKMELKYPDSPLPKGWAWTSLIEASCVVVDCHNKTAPYVSRGIPLIRTTNIRNGELSIEEVKYVSDSTYKKWSKRCPPISGDILFTREAPAGECCIIPEGITLCMGQRLMLVRPFHDLVSKEYLLFTMMSPNFQKRVTGSSIGMGAKHLRVGDVERAFVPLPPYKEQLRIVDAVQKIFPFIETLHGETKKQFQFGNRFEIMFKKELLENVHV